MARTHWIDHDGKYFATAREEPADADLTCYEKLMVASLGCARIEESGSRITVTARVSGLLPACASELARIVTMTLHTDVRIALRDVGRLDELITIDSDVAVDHFRNAGPRGKGFGDKCPLTFKQAQSGKMFGIRNLLIDT